MNAAPEVAFVGLGGNVGDAATTLRQAAAELDALPGSRLLRLSSLYRTAAWGLTDQPDFINAAAAVRTTLAPQALLDALLRIECRHGRDRGREQRWGPRTLDLDLLLHGQRRMQESGLRLPHPHLHERAFVLVPLAEIAPDARIPGVGTVGDALARLPPDAVAGVVPLQGAATDSHILSR